jgi:AcrR family transcriptional regulator
MPRPTKSEIDAEIIDKAAGLFARHGFDRTSIQQIADALGYSKAGLLHHYASKKLLYEAVLETHEALVDEMLTELEPIPAGIARDRAFAESAIAFWFDWPGIAALGQRWSLDGSGDEPRLTRIGLKAFALLGIDVNAPDLERMARVLVATSGGAFVSRFATDLGLQRELRDQIVATVLDALGHGGGVSPPGRTSP